MIPAKAGIVVLRVRVDPIFMRRHKVFGGQFLPDMRMPNYLSRLYFV